MAYKIGSENIQDIVISSLKEGKKPIILFYNGNNDKFYEVKEFVGIVTQIIKRGQKGEISKIEVMFAENKKAETMVFIDDNIVEGSLISLIGYFLDYGSWGLCFTAKCGSNEVLTTLKDTYLANKLNVNKIYRTGLIFELSKVELPKEYSRSEKISKIEGLQNFYYMVEDYNVQQNNEPKVNSILRNMGYVKNDPNIISEPEKAEDMPNFEEIDKLEDNMYNEKIHNQNETTNVEENILKEIMKNSEETLEEFNNIG